MTPGQEAKKLVLALSLLWLLFGLSGCSVVMALHGKKEPNMQALHVGSSRHEVEEELGAPIQVIPSQNGLRTDVYEYERGNSPSVARALVHIFYDVVTFGLYEIVGTAAEAMLGEKVKIPIVYGTNDRVVAINEYASDQPPNPPILQPQSQTKDENLVLAPLSDVDRIPTTTQQSRASAYAVLFGIESYRNGLPKADFAAHDATIIAEYLTKGMGFPEDNVVLRINEHASLTDLSKYLEKWLPNNVEKDSSVFVYYSGHGAPNPKTGEAYLVPYDGDPSFLETTGYPLNRLYEALNKLPAKEVIVVLDSCFSGAGGRSVMAKGARPAALKIENPLLLSTKLSVLTASSGEQISSTYEKKSHGLFTYFMLKGLQGEADINGDQVVELGELFDYVKPQVERVARKIYNHEQTPQLISAEGQHIRLIEAAR